MFVVKSKVQDLFGLPLAMMGGLIRQVAFSQMRVLQHAADTAKKFYGGNASLVDTAGLREVRSKMGFWGGLQSE